MFFAVGFLWLVLAPACTIAIDISPEAGLRNASTAIIRSVDDDAIPIPTALKTNRTLGTEISTSERHRRLIPYMAYYLPPTEYPINQQYVVQVPSKQAQHQAAQKSQKPQHVPGAIPLPTAYVHMKVPINNQPSHHTIHNQHHSSSPAFQTIVYGGQHPLSRIQENNMHAVKVPPQQHSILPPSAGESQRLPIPISQNDSGLPKFKPIVHQPQYHQSLPQQHPPASINAQKINLTPFTPSNTVPGHFIPIIYTNERSNSVNYKPTAPSSTSVDSHHQLHSSHPSEAHKQPNPNDYHHHRQHEDIVVSIPSTSAQLHPQTLSQIQQQNRQHVQYVSVSPTPSPTQSSTFRIISDLPVGNHRQQHHHQQLIEKQIAHTDNLTPQQKYVIYLQQQLRYKQHQQLQEHQEKRIQLEKQLQQQSQSYFGQQSEPHQTHQYPSTDQVYAVTPTPNPVPSTTSHPSTQALDIHHDNHHNPNRFNEKYPQHSPINHAVYQNPDAVQPNFEQLPPHYPSKHQQQSYPLPHRPEHHRFTQHQLQSHQYASNPNYVEYIIDDPKQEIEEQTSAPEKEQLHSIRPPPIHLVSNNPVPAPPPVEVVVTSPRPLYKNQPTLRLHAISPTPRPSSSYRPHTNFSPRPATPTPPMVFVSPKPKFTQLYPSVPVNKPKSSHTDYQPVVDTAKYGVPLKDEDPLPNIRTSSLAEILRKLQESNHLPQTLTPDNIDNSIRTLIKILHNLKNSQTIVENPSQHHDMEEEYYSNSHGTTEDESPPAHQDLSAPISGTPRPGPNSGRPGVDYPTLARIPATSFSCQEQRYKGFFGDPETNCQVWHYCDLNGGKASFLCPNGTIFSQIALTCDWWFNVKCATTPQLYVLNERLYKYILPFTPKFPEDYSGPLVDKYLALKFKEMEEKMRREKLKGRGGESTESGSTTDDDEVTTISVENESTEALKASKIEADIGGLSAIGEQSSERNLLIDEETGRITSRQSVPTNAYNTTQATTIAVTKELPLSLRPIVVSTAATPFSIEESDDDSKSMESQVNDKVSVEKLEVIEIKTDGTSGHLIPERRYGSVDT